MRKIPTVWASPLSLATTYGIDFSFFSNSYLDVSVHCVYNIHLWIQCTLVRESRDQHLFDSFPRLIAVFHALQSLLMPRHPPCALNSLITNIRRSLPDTPKRHATKSFGHLQTLLSPKELIHLRESNVLTIQYLLKRSIKSRHALTCQFRTL